MEFNEESWATLRGLLYQLLVHRRARPSETAAFVGLRHNADLCPMVQERCDQILQAVERQRSITYDTQGLRDDGVDVLLVLATTDDTAAFVAFQVKSDIEADRTVLTTLKTQWTDAQNRYGPRLLDYYILLAWDGTTRLDQIRAVENAFAGIEKVRVIEPAYCWAFLQDLTLTTIEAFASSYLHDDDPLLMEARKSVSGLTRVQLAMVLEVLNAYTDPAQGNPTYESLRASTFVATIYSTMADITKLEQELVEMDIKVPELQGQTRESANPTVEEVAGDLDRLEDWIVSNDAGEFGLVESDLLPLIALAYDARARFRHFGDDFLWYMFRLLTLAGRPRHAEPDAGEPRWYDIEAVRETIIERVSDEAERVPLLASLLKTNFSASAAALARYYGLTGLDSDGEAGWIALADAVIQDESWEYEEDAADDETD